MPEAPKSTQQHGVFLDARVLLVGGAVALLGVVVLTFFLWMVPSAAAREAKAACAGLISQPPLNPALCPNGGQCKYPVPAPDFTAYDHNGKPVHLSDFRGKVVLLNFWASWCGVCETEKPHLEHMAKELQNGDFVVVALASDKTWNDVVIAIIAALAPRSGMEEAMKVTGEDEGAVTRLGKIMRTHPKERDDIFTFLKRSHNDAFLARVDAAIGKTPPPLTEILEAYQAALPNGVPFDVLLDPPAGDDNIGQIAASWGIKAVPESALIDRQGNIRHYFVNKRDWEMPVAETCLRSVIDE